MLTIYEKITFFVVFVWFVWLLLKYKNSFFLFLLKFGLLMLDLSPEAVTRGVLHKMLFLEILQYSHENICVRVLTQT